MTDAREWLTDASHAPQTDAAERTRDALLAVLDLHREQIGLDDVLRYCYDCEENWPCSTVRAIDKALGVAE